MEININFLNNKKILFYCKIIILKKYFYFFKINRKNKI
jgi:hypothetical protein